jgi:putative membrane protein
MPRRDDRRLMSRTSLTRLLLGPVMGTAITLAAVSPQMHAAADASVAAHMIQHLVLILVAAPLLALGQPVRLAVAIIPVRVWRAVARAFRRSPIRAGHAVVLAITACFAHFVVVWAWHSPRFYERALASPTVHALEHLSFVVTAYAFWLAVLGRRALGPGGAIFVLFVAAGQGTVLGALLTLAETPWYAAHVPAGRAGSLTALEDQQLAGLFMWIGGGLAYAAGALVMLARIVRERSATTRSVATASAPGDSR